MPLLQNYLASGIMYKDYYRILEVPSTATGSEIKKSYRRLALQYHPDKHFGNNIYEAKFKEIQEAYHILSDVKKRQEYNNRRNDQQFTEKKKTQPVVTPQTILVQTIDFRKKVSVLDPERMNKLALYQQIQQILAVGNIQILQRNNDLKLNKKIIDEIIYCSRHLPYPHVEKICFQLTALAGTDNASYRRIYNFSKEVRQREYWNRYKVIAAILVSIFLCLAIYFLSTTI